MAPQLPKILASIQAFFRQNVSILLPETSHGFFKSLHHASCPFYLYISLPSSLSTKIYIKKIECRTPLTCTCTHPLSARYFFFLILFFLHSMFFQNSPIFIYISFLNVLSVQNVQNRNQVLFWTVHLPYTSVHLLLYNFR
jgi:hypothetical protein